MPLLTAGAATMLVALADGCCDALRSIAGTSQPVDSRPQVALRPTVAQGLARAPTDVRAARMAVRNAVDSLCEPAAGEEVPPELRAAVFEAVDLARRLTLGAIRSSYELGGSASV